MSDMSTLEIENQNIEIEKALADAPRQLDVWRQTLAYNQGVLNERKRHLDTMSAMAAEPVDEVIEVETTPDEVIEVETTQSVDQYDVIDVPSELV